MMISTILLLCFSVTVHNRATRGQWRSFLWWLRLNSCLFVQRFKHCKSFQSSLRENACCKYYIRLKIWCRMSRLNCLLSSWFNKHYLFAHAQWDLLLCIHMYVDCLIGQEMTCSLCKCVEFRSRLTARVGDHLNFPDSQFQFQYNTYLFWDFLQNILLQLNTLNKNQQPKEQPTNKLDSYKFQTSLKASIQPVIQ